MICVRFRLVKKSEYLIPRKLSCVMAKPSKTSHGCLASAFPYEITNIPEVLDSSILIIRDLAMMCVNFTKRHVSLIRELGQWTKQYSLLCRMNFNALENGINLV